MTDHPAGVPRACDVLVIGGGPGGSAAASLLATWGHTVVLIDREPTRPPLVESIPPSAEGLLQAVGVGGAVADGGFLKSTGNTVWWEGGDRRVEYFPGGRIGYQVLRSDFDVLLRARAVEAGARVVRPASATHVTRVGDLWHTTVSTDECETTIISRWVIDATGRAGLLARQQRVRASADLRTIALAAAWDNAAGWELPDVSHTLVESAAWGWGWSVPATLVRRYVTVMLDPAATRAAGPHDLEERYHGYLAQLPALGALCRGAQQASAVFACDASPYHAADPAGEGWLAVGDASSFIDPLSSFGVKKALASGWLAAVTLHTCLTTPQTQGAALALFRSRERAYVAAADTALQALSTNTGQHGAFWGARQSLESDETTDHLAARLREAPDVLAAFGELRTRPTLRMAPGRAHRMARPFVRGNLVVEEPHLILAGIDEPIRFLRNVDLVALTDLACQHDDVGSLFDRYTGTLGPVALPDFLGSLAVLTARGALDFA